MKRKIYTENYLIGNVWLVTVYVSQPTFTVRMISMFVSSPLFMITLLVQSLVYLTVGFRLQADFGVLFDVDGVLARGSTPLVAAEQAIRLLEDEEGRMKVPVAFVTNACNRSHDKANQLQKWLDIHVIMFCLFVSTCFHIVMLIF